MADFGSLSPDDYAMPVASSDADYIAMLRAALARARGMAQGIGQSIAGAASAPGDAMRATAQPSTPGIWSDEDEARKQLTEGNLANRATDLAGFVSGGGFAAPAERDAVGMGVRAYHGSPHDFDKFDLSKIGTGEGAQAYGHGLYFAENPKVAESYKKEYVPNTTLAGRFGFAPAKIPNEANPGKFYEVNINADPDHFLDWDKPLSEHSPKVQKALADIWGPMTSENMKNWSGNGFAPRTPEDVQKLRDAGIPGIRYLDSGSRGAEGKPTYNYVVFDDKMIDILKKYGLAGLIGAPAAAGAMNSDKTQPFGSLAP